VTSARKRLFAGVVSSLAVLAITNPASAETLPFTDASTSAAIGFCDRGGHPITSGSIADRPFSWTAVSSAPAPEAFRKKGSRTTLYAFQPRQNVDPSQWSGKQLTAASTYSNANHPMAAGTLMDAAMVDFTSIAPLWQGLVQVRMYYSAPNTPQHSRPYPAAVIRVTGTTWTLVSGDQNPDCRSGTSVSAEVNVVPSAKLFGASSPITGTPESTGAPDTSAAPSTTAGGTATGASTGAPLASAPSLAGARNDSSSNGVPVAAIAASGGAVAALIGVVAFLLWRRQSHPD
jgi:hypothetical protein